MLEREFFLGFIKIHSTRLLKKKLKGGGRKVRKYYTATEEGKEALEQAKTKIRMLVEEVVK